MALEQIENSAPDGLLVVCASFEERRCREVVQRASGYKAKCTVVLNFNSSSGKSGSKKQEDSVIFLLDRLRLLDVRGIPRLISVDPYDFFGLWFLLTDELNRHGFGWGSMTATIDISCLTKVQMIFLLREILLTGALTKCRLVYTVPESYNRERGDKFSWLSVGYFDPVVFPIRAEYRATTSRRRVALALLGHEGQRTLTAWRHVDPDETILLFARSDNERMMEISRRENDFLIAHIGGDGHENFLNCNFLDIIGARDMVAERLRDIEEQGNVTLSFIPFGPKPMVVGALMAILEARRADVELVYPIPISYNPEYSGGAKDVFFFDFLG
ncbi:MAG TPA: hypothetical protein VGM86_24705 [Thermoanaerobaculia bacterium]